MMSAAARDPGDDGGGLRPRTPRWARLTCLLLVPAGMAAFVVGLSMGPARSSDPMGPEVVARVDGQPVELLRLRRALDAVSSRKKEEPSRETRARLLAGVIQEELLFQQARRLGILDNDELIRRRAVQKVLELARLEVKGRPVDEEALRAFYRGHEAGFVREDRVRITQIFVPAGKDEAREGQAASLARQLHQRLEAGETWEEVAASSTHPVPLGKFSGWLVAGKLTDYFGEKLSKAVMSTRKGEYTEPVRTGLGHHVVRVLDRAGGDAPPFEKVRSRVLEKYRRALSRAAVDSYLGLLRRQARVEINPVLDQLMEGAGN